MYMYGGDMAGAIRVFSFRLAHFEGLSAGVRLKTNLFVMLKGLMQQTPLVNGTTAGFQSDGENSVLSLWPQKAGCR